MMRECEEKYEGEAKAASFSAFINLRRFERESRRRLYRGFIFAVVVMNLLLLFRPSRPQYFRPPEAPRWEIIGDLIEIPASGNGLHGGDGAFRAPYIPEKRLPVFKKPPVDLRAILSPPDPWGDEYRRYTDRQIRMLTEIFTRDIAESGRPRDPGFPKWKEWGSGIGLQTGDRRGISTDEINLAGIDSLGIFGGFVIQDPNNRRKLKGFAYIPSMVRGIKAGYSLPGNAIPGFIEAMNPFTDVKLKLAPPVTLSSPEMLRYPLIYISASARSVLELKTADIGRFGEYLRKGGFAILDNGSPRSEFTVNDAAFVYLIRNALGDEARFDPIPPDNLLFHCYFDIAHPLPVGKEPKKGKRRASAAADTTFLPTDRGGDFARYSAVQEWRERKEADPGRLWGVWLKDRLVAVFMDKGYGRLWQAGKRTYEEPSSETAMELGVNMVVFALTQKGGIAVQYAGR